MQIKPRTLMLPTKHLQNYYFLRSDQWHNPPSTSMAQWLNGINEWSTRQFPGTNIFLQSTDVGSMIANKEATVMMITMEFHCSVLGTMSDWHISLKKSFQHSKQDCCSHIVRRTASPEPLIQILKADKLLVRKIKQYKLSTSYLIKECSFPKDSTAAARHN